jgi:DNA repair exonuclease SbcCD ATPase subunit/DNA repair exonuclease SbcCD nuclease subunit
MNNFKTKRIAHISDTHIRNLKYHTEYRHVFNQIYDSLKQEQPDYIVHTGDLAHTKTQLSPEYFEMASNFLKNLSDIAPTIIILGNHDGNLKNGDRQDAVTPIVDALQHPNLTLLKESQEYSPEDGLSFNVLSVFDRNNWKKPSNSKNINIALYHGAVRGSQVGSGYCLDHGEDGLDIFSEFDYAMLGDIHKTQFLDQEKRIWYSGSTVQQNFGESRMKGYIIWNIYDKDRHVVEKRLFQSPRPFITVNITKDGQLPNETVPRNARLRLVCEHNLPRARLVRIQDYAQTKWSPHSVQLLNKNNASVSSETDSKSINVRDQNTFDKYMQDFLSTRNIAPDVLERSVEISREYFRKHVSSDNPRNITWKLKKMKWDYLFNYGKNNSLDFSSLSGLVGIFGKNYSGKSSIIDAALFGLFNTTSKGERKNVHIINQNQEKASCKLEITIGDDLYKINRSLEKTTSRSKGREVEGAKTSLDFTKFEIGTKAESKNGDTRNKTDQNIQNTFGGVQDFLMTSLAAQHDSFGFINEGSTKRKAILAKFLDLEIFDEMHKAVKKDSSEMRGLIKHLNSVDWEKKLKRANSEYSEILDEIRTKKSECESHERRLNTLLEEQTIINDQVLAASQKDIDIDRVRKDLLKAQKGLKKASQELASLSTQLLEKRERIAILEPSRKELLSKASVAEENLKVVEERKSYLKEKRTLLDSLIRKRNTLQGKIDLLDDHEYDPDCSFCCDNKFVKQAQKAKLEIVEVKNEIDFAKAKIEIIEGLLKSLGEESLRKDIQDFVDVDMEFLSLRDEIMHLSLKYENEEGKISLLEHRIPKYLEDISYYNENIEAYENLSSLRRELKAITQTITIKQKACKRCQEQLLELMSEKGSTNRTIEEAREGIQKIKNAERDYIAYDLFVQATHANGISYEVIKSMLSIINSEIASVLSSIVDFEVIIDNDGDSLEIYIKHPNFDPRPLSMGSGAEKTIASMAIRLALISVSSLPKPSSFWLDEPGTALDAEHMEGFVRLLQMIKAQFETVFLITHLETLKDVVDKTIEIDKIDGYAQVKL